MDIKETVPTVATVFTLEYYVVIFMSFHAAR